MPKKGSSRKGKFSMKTAAFSKNPFSTQATALRNFPGSESKKYFLKNKKISRVWPNHAGFLTYLPTVCYGIHSDTGVGGGAGAQNPCNATCYSLSKKSMRFPQAQAVFCKSRLTLQKQVQSCHAVQVTAHGRSLLMQQVTAHAGHSRPQESPSCSMSAKLLQNCKQ